MTYGLESFWSLFKQVYMGTFHKLLPKHLDQYVQEFAGRHNIRNLGMPAKMARVVEHMVGKRPRYQTLITDNGPPSGTGS